MHTGTYVIVCTAADKASNQERRPRDGEDETCAQELIFGRTDRRTVVAWLCLELCAMKATLFGSIQRRAVSVRRRAD